jgi:type I restriction enzyme S subunit
VTTGWVVRPLRAIAEVSLGRQRSPGRAEGPNMVPYLRAANVKDGRLDLGDVKLMDFDASEQSIFGLQRGDVLVTEGAGSLAAVGASAVYNGEIDGVVCFQNTVLRLRPRKGTDTRYLMWWARHAYGSGIFASISEGANIFHLGAGNVRVLPVAVPEISTQRAIAEYLDEATARIDQLLQAKRRMLRLLDLRRAAAIAAAITGELPETRAFFWDVDSRPLRVYARVDLGRARTPDSSDGPTMVPYIRAANVKNGYLELDSVLEMNFTPAEQLKFALQPGDVLVTEGAGSLAAVGANAVWNTELGGTVCFQNHLLRLRATHRSDPRFIAWWARHAYESGLFASLATGAQILNLGAENVRSLLVRIPALEAQRAISDLLDRSIGAIEATKSRLVHQVDLLQQRRALVVTAAVTGELEIRGTAA